MSSRSKCAGTMEKSRWLGYVGLRPDVDGMMGSQSPEYGGEEVGKPRISSYACVELFGSGPHW